MSILLSRLIKITRSQHSLQKLQTDYRLHIVLEKLSAYMYIIDLMWTNIEDFSIPLRKCRWIINSTLHIILLLPCRVPCSNLKSSLFRLVLLLQGYLTSGAVALWSAGDISRAGAAYPVQPYVLRISCPMIILCIHYSTIKYFWCVD